MNQSKVEQVLVVPTSLFHELGHFQGFCQDTQRYIGPLLDEKNTRYLPRPEAEDDPGFKQLIPYVVFRYLDPVAGEVVFQYTRGSGQGERRLHSKRSIGIGGHISTLDDGRGTHVYQEGMRRELDEEVHIGSPYTDKCVGLINDDQTDVGRVHLGVVHLFDLEHPAVEPREAEMIECGFRPVGQLLTELEGFESWSQICLEALFKP